MGDNVARAMQMTDIWVTFKQVTVKRLTAAQCLYTKARKEIGDKHIARSKKLCNRNVDERVIWLQLIDALMTDSNLSDTWMIGSYLNDMV